jgi:hypothetical protein
MTTSGSGDAPRIFICYRRGDSAAACSHLYDRLVTRYGREAIFKDVDDIPFGTNFPPYLEQQLHICRIKLVIIGKFWLTLANPGGGRRLDNPNDFVLIEIETGLRDGLTVIPVLVDGATMPLADGLPESIRTLATLNAAQLRNDPDFNTDIERLFRQLDLGLGIMPESTTTPIQGTKCLLRRPASEPLNTLRRKGY